MSRWKLPAVVLATALLAGACTEDAAPPSGGATSRLAAHEPEARHRPPRDDADRPSRAELQARREVHRQELLARFDADHDGALSADERAAAHQARVAEMIAHLDTDGSGTLSAAEFDARPGRGHHRGPDFATIDADHDGAISAGELAALRPPPPGPPPGDDDDDDRPPPPPDEPE